MPAELVGIEWWRDVARVLANPPHAVIERTELANDPARLKRMFEASPAAPDEQYTRAATCLGMVRLLNGSWQFLYILHC